MTWRAMVLAMFAATSVAAQQTIDLAGAMQAAASADPRIQQLQLEAEQTELRVRNIESEILPSLTVQGLAQYQSEVVRIPVVLPSGASPLAPKETLDASVLVDQVLLDPSRRARIDAERARLAEAQARVRAALYPLRQEVNEAFFAAALLQEREAQIATSITDLEARLREATTRVENGAALPSEAASIEATLLRRRQDVSELRASRQAAIARLSKLTGNEISVNDRLAIPALDSQFIELRSQSPAIRERPEFAQFAATRDRLETLKELSRAEQRVRVSAFGRLAYGKPGLNFLRDEFHEYWLAGVRLQWKPWDWGKAERDQKIAELQQQAVQADEDAFARTLERSIENDVAAADRLRETVTTDDRIVALRELIERETRARYDEHVVTAADYVDKETDVLEARLLRAAHRVELAQAQARVLNILGVEIR